MASTPDRHPATDELIAQLAGEARPVRRLWPPRARLGLWLALQVLVLAAAAVVLDLRPDAASKLREGAFAAEIALLFSIGSLDAALALLAAVPGRQPAAVPLLGSLAVVVGALGIAYGSEPAVRDSLAQLVALGWPCAAHAAAVAAAPWALLLIALRRGAPLAPGVAGALGGLAAFCIAAAALRLTCPVDTRWHLLVWHLAPVALAAGLSFWIGILWLSRWRERRG